MEQAGWNLPLKIVFFRRIPGKVRDDGVRVFEIEHRENGIISGLILPFDDGIVHTAFLYRTVVLEHSPAVEPDPCKSGAGNRDLDGGVCLKVLVDVLLAVGAKPEFPVLLETEHEGAAFWFAVAADGCKVLDWVFGQEFDDFVHDETS